MKRKKSTGLVNKVIDVTGLATKERSARRLILSAFARQTAVNSSMTLIASSLTALLIYPYVPHLWLGLWWSSISGLAIYLLLMKQIHHRSKKGESAQPKQDRKLSGLDATFLKACVIAAMSGGLWGAGVSFLPFVPQNLLPFIVIVAGAMAGGAATTLAAIPLAAHLYVLLTILPYAAYFLFLDGNAENLSLGILAVVMATGMVWATRLVYGSVLKELGLRDRNFTLIDLFQSERDEWLDVAFSADAYAVFDPDGLLQVWNERFTSFLDVQSSDVASGMSIKDIVSLLMPPKGVGRGSTFHRDWVDLIVGLNNDRDERIPKRQISDGRWVRMAMRTTRSGSRVLVVSDETELVVREVALLEGERRFEAYAKIAQDELIAISGEDHKVKQWICSDNPNFKASWRQPPLGLPLFKVISHWEDEASSRSTLLGLLDKNQAFRDHTVFIRTGISSLIKEISGVPFGDGINGKGGFLLTVTDVTVKRAEQLQAQVQNLRFKALAEVASERVWDIDPDGIVKSVTGAKRRDTGTDFIGTHFQDVWKTDIAEIDAQHSLAELIEQREIVRGFEYQARLKGKQEWRFFRATGLPLYHTSGDYLGYCLAVRDVSATKSLEQENQRRSKEIRDLTENLSAGLFRVKAAEDGWVSEYANTWLAREYGVKHYALEALVSDKATPFISSSDAAQRRETIAAYEATNTSYECKWQLRLPDGRKRWILERGKFLTSDDGINRIEGILWDVTVMVQYEEAMLDGKKRLSEALSALESAKDAIAIQNEKGELAYTNNAARKLMMAESNASKDRHFITLLNLPESEKNDLKKEIEVSIPVFGHWEKTIPIAAPEQGVRTYDMRINKSPDGGMVYLASDVTAKRRFEAEEQKLRAELSEAKQLQEIGQLAGGIAHDFANVISAVQSFSDLIIDEAQTGSREQAYADKISQACGRASDMVEQIVLLAKSSNLETEAIVLKEVFVQAEDLLSNSFDEFAQFEINYPSAELVVESSKSGLLQILLNLSLNALQSLEGGEGRVNVFVEPAKFSESDLEMFSEGRRQVDSPRDGRAPLYRVVDGGLRTGIHYACISVQDDGVGIGIENIGRITEPFFTTKENVKGTGLGLAIVRNVVSRSMGVLVVESRIGEGTCFKAYVPVSSRVPRALQASLSSGAIKGLVDVNRPGRILVVDDEVDLSDILSTALSKIGYDATNTYSGDEAWEVFRDDPSAWDVIITDQVMPGLRGTELIKKVREVREDIPIILCTAYSELLTQTSAIDLGANIFMTKPVSIKDLVENVGSFFE